MTKWPSLRNFFRQKNETAAAPASSPAPAVERLIQGYIDEITPAHVTGWARNGRDAAERLELEIVLQLPEGERVLTTSRADQYYAPIGNDPFGDGKYGFRAELPAGLNARDLASLIVRVAGTKAALQRAGKFQGCVDQRSVFHVAGWVRNRFDPTERLTVEVVVAAPEGERVIATGIANRFTRALEQHQIGDAYYGFLIILPKPLSEAERDSVIVRPVGTDFVLELTPQMRTQYELLEYVAMDIINNCNLRCPFCLFDYSDTKSTRFMADETFDSALRLLPLLGDAGLWLSCLHEPSMHPKFVEFIARIPREHRHKIMFTTNLAKRMPAEYFAALADSGVFHINLSLESLDPPVYEKFRKGARWPIFKENWDRMIEAWKAAPAPPRLRYIILAYKSNFAEIPSLVKYLREERFAWQVEVRYTFELDHLPESFRQAEFLHEPDWQWLGAQLADYPPHEVVFMPPAPPPAPMAPGPAPASDAGSEAAPAPARAEERAQILPIVPLNLRISWDGNIVVCDKRDHPTQQLFVASGNLEQIQNPFEFLQRIALSPLPGTIFGFVDEITPHSVTGWIRNYSDPAELVDFDVVLALPEGETRIAHATADQFCQSLADAGFHDPEHGFTVTFSEPLSAEARDGLEIRPLGAPVPLRRAPKYQGYIDERSTRHVQGWIRNRFDPEERVEFEVVDIADKFERVLGRGIADLLDPELAARHIGDARYGFRFLFTPPLTEAVRDSVIVRPIMRPMPLELSPRLVTAFAEV